MKEEIKEITNKMIKTSQPNGVFLTAGTRDKIIYYINNSLEEIERLNNIINESRRMLGEYKHYSTPDEIQNMLNEEIVDEAYTILHKDLDKEIRSKNDD